MGYRFIDNEGTFELEGANLNKYLYFPLCNEAGMMSCVTPTLGGDAKLSQNSFILEPVSVENLHNNRSTRNFWLRFEDNSLRSATGVSVWQEAEGSLTKVRAGLLWHEAENRIRHNGLELCSRITSFVPVDNTTAEIMRVRIENIGSERATFSPVCVIPLYGRSAVNQRDHRHVTSLLHRTYVGKYGVSVIPTMTFDERGHKRNELEYYVAAAGEISRLYPSVMDVLAESGSWTRPDGIASGADAKFISPAADDSLVLVSEGREAVGGIEFKKCAVLPGEAVEFVIIIGAHGADEEYSAPKAVVERFGSSEKCEQALSDVKEYWKKKIELRSNASDSDYNNIMLWVGAQPYLRKIMGCSFLPYHDYGKGGRGWRDLWQDCLALLLMNPSSVRSDLINNFAGVRPDGTNATIIGTKPGEFIADRNGIVRVWMDHAVWPWKTTELYIRKTGDYGILEEQQVYFRDRQHNRGRVLSDVTDGKTFTGTVLEHLLLMHLTVAGDLGEHGHMALRGADWNDALDMAPDRGESVAFTAAYSGNLVEMAELFGGLEVKTGEKGTKLNKNIVQLLRDISSAGDDCTKRKAAVDCYCKNEFADSEPEFVTYKELSDILLKLGQSIAEHIRSTERMEKDGCIWYNGYYDNQGCPVESLEKGRVMLTSGVFTIMAGVAPDEELDAMIATANKYLLRENMGGFSLNTRFENESYYAANMGRAFGFSYGDKENGAVFSHMAVMFAYALKKRGKLKEADRVIRELYEQSARFEASRMYPGIPEYFDIDGRGMYTYLTGAASWMLLYLYE